MKANRHTARPPRPEAREFASFADFAAALFSWLLLRRPDWSGEAWLPGYAHDRAADAWGMR